MTQLIVAHSESDFLILRWGSLFITVFRGPILARHMELARPLAYEAIRDARDGGALLSIFEASASEQGLESRGLAAELFEDAGRTVRAVAIVYEGHGPEVAVLQERTRDVMTRAGTQAPLMTSESLAPAARWVLETAKLGASPDETAQLVRAIDQARARKASPRG